MHQRGCEIKPALHATGVIRDEIVAAVFQPNELKQLRDATLQLSSMDAVDAAKEPQVLSCGQHWIHRILLRRYADHRANRSPLLADTVAQKQRIATRWMP